jgi:hypothetical protein
MNYFRTSMLFVLVFCCATIFAQETASNNQLLTEAQAAYDDGRFDDAELKALRGLQGTTDSLAAIPFRVLLGSVYVARDQNDFAYREFSQVVAINPAYDLDPVTTSPKIMEVFRKAKTDYMDMVMTQPEIFRLPQADVRLAASGRSLVLPGWGQFYKEQRIKGTVVIAVQVLSLAALAVMQAEVDRRHDDYLSVNEYHSPVVDDRYQEYRRAYRMRNAVGYVALGVYILNYFDALYTPVTRRK